MKKKSFIGGVLFLLGLTAACCIEGNIIITFSAIATMVAGGLVANLFDFGKEARQ